MSGTAARASRYIKLALLAALLALAGTLWSENVRESRLIAQHDVRAQTGEHGVVVFEAEWCGQCKRLKRWLDAAGVPYRALDVEKSTAAAYGQIAVVGRGAGVPTTVIGQDVIYGLRTERLKERLTLAGFAMRGDP